MRRKDSLNWIIHDGGWRKGQLHWMFRILWKCVMNFNSEINTKAK